MIKTDVARIDDASFFIRSAMITALSSLLIGLFAKVSIPLPFTPVPLATQGIVVLILSAFLGSQRAAIAVLGFLFQGALGFPVFSGGLGGAACLFGPTGGYLAGYLAGAYLTGFLVENMREFTFSKLFYALGVGNLMFFCFGVPYLSVFIGLEKAFVLGFLPFVVGDLFKLFIASKAVFSFFNYFRS